MGELDRAHRPTSPTRRTSELDRTQRPTRRTGELDRMPFTGPGRYTRQTCTGGIAYLDIRTLLNVAGGRHLGGGKFLRENAKKTWKLRECGKNEEWKFRSRRLERNGSRNKRAVQLAEWASWTEHTVQLVQLAEQASWTERNVQFAERVSWTERIVQLARSASWTRPYAFHRTCTVQSLVSYRSELPLELYNKNREDLFSHKVHGYRINGNGELNTTVAKIYEKCGLPR
ncbi:hypothetical protein F2Q69_00047549 [Brassica cretica]|uniref:Uncharacterized protein n=1 Tax=Brassica cretica TaxID=69181 RepID=A0A8S9PQ27_BRACR|nr:hypothetical protein F2Q69_00047549 [Brassica cretica]